ncbi:MAG: SpvB/TcaC N-terminal domain-containing protein [Byssovorax sp.]
MLWILSTLPTFAGSITRRAGQALLPLLLVVGFVLSGAGCRSDNPPAQPLGLPTLDDSDTSPVAGTIQGAFAVSSTGESTYSLSLVVPPGAAGMQPSLAVTYSSVSGDGMLGMGFSLTGLSAVTRCPRSMGHLLAWRRA